MTKTLTVCSVAIIIAFTGSLCQAEEKAPKALNFTMKSLAGKPVELSKYEGKVVLIVNTASECGLTPQYEQLQALHKKYNERGLMVLGFPCNQFGQQEPGTAKDIQEFCKVNYGVTFDMFSKVEVNGVDACPLYKYLTSVDTKPAGSGKITWNFEKFVLDRKGNLIARFAPRTKPDAPAVLAVLDQALGE
jgi:glutathione peroxidase